MDGVSVAASIVGIATAGVQVSIKLITLATQISTASERITSIGNDVSLTSGVLHQLGELMNQKTTAHGISIFSQGGMETTRTSAAMCEKIFLEIEKEAGKASKQIGGMKMPTGGKIKLSRMEKAKWPFLQPSIDVLRTDLREAKGTLMLMLQVTSLALSKKMADLNSSASISIMEQQNIVRAIMALQQQQRTDGRQEGQAKGPLIANLEEANKPIPGGTSHSVTPISVKKDTSTYLTQDNPHTGSPSSYKVVDQSGRQNVGSEVDAVDDTPKNFEPSTTPAAIGVSEPTIIDPSQQWHPGDHSPDAIDGASVSQQQISKRTLTSTSTEKNGDTHHVPFGLSPSQVKANSNSSKSTSKNDSVEYRMFLIRPSVRDRKETIQVSWNITDTNMQQSEIRKQLILYERENLPSVLEQLETLHAYELSHINSTIQHASFPISASSYELVALKRTWTEIHHREMFLSSLPGLQCVVQRTSSSTSSSIQSPQVLLHEHIRPGRRDREIANRNLYLRTARGLERGPYEHIAERGPDQDSRGSRSLRSKDLDMECATSGHIDESEETYSIEESEFTDNINEEQVITELLGKYTTLYG